MMDAMAAAKIFAYCTLALILLIIICANAYRRGRFDPILRWIKKKFGIGQFVEEKKEPKWRRRRVDRSWKEKHYFVIYKEEDCEKADAPDSISPAANTVKESSEAELCKLLEDTDLGVNSEQKIGVNGEQKIGMNDEQEVGVNGEQNIDMNGEQKIGVNGEPEIAVEAEKKRINCGLLKSDASDCTDSPLKDNDVTSVARETNQECKLAETRVSTSEEQPSGVLTERIVVTDNGSTKVKEKACVSFVSQVSKDSVMKEVFQMFVGERAVYLYSSDEKELGCDLVSHFHPELIISFETCSDYKLLKFPPPPDLYSTLSDSYSVKDNVVERICLMESANVTIQHEVKGSSVCMERCTVPQWGPYKDIDYASLQILHDKLTTLSEKKPNEKLKIIIHSSESIYVSTIIMLECLESMDDITMPAEIVKRLKQMNSLEINDRDRKWVLHSLALCSKLQLQNITLDTLMERHPLESISIEFCESVLQTLKELVPDMNMSQCVAAVQDCNRFQNRKCTILPLDSEKPYLGGPTVSPAECDYLNASFIKGYHSGYEYIVTEWPQFRTIPSFWRLVYLYEIPTIIIVAPSGPLKQKRYPVFWPQRGREKKYASFGRYTVKAIADHLTQSEVFHTTHFKVTEQNVGFSISHTCKIHYIPKWPALTKSSDDPFITGIFKLLFDEWQQHRRHGKETKLCVVSSDGASKCGILFSVWSIFDQIGSSESRVFDCMNAIRLTKLNRPKLVNNVEEVEIIYRILHQIAEKRTSIKNFFNKRLLTSSVSSLNSYKLALSDGVS
ncbi:uncharacterized protein [Watersipora subatra]|uniref:uncharacterized protein n=1 Tax=Watersipora subatra TaxID=2589382 RepID=UPI00355C77E1